MAELGIAPHVLDRVINPVSGTIKGMVAIYNRFQYLDERRDALCAWGNFIERLICPDRATNGDHGALIG